MRISETNQEHTCMHGEAIIMTRTLRGKKEVFSANMY